MDSFRYGVKSEFLIDVKVMSLQITNWFRLHFSIFFPNFVGQYNVRLSLLVNKVSQKYIDRLS